MSIGCTPRVYLGLCADARDIIFGSRNKFHPPEVERMTIEAIELRMMEEVTVRIDGTDVRAGLMGELGTTGDRIFPNEEKGLIAAGRVNCKTNVPIMVHTEGSEQTVMAALGILQANGANLEKVNICHVNGAGYWRDVIEAGAYVGLDCFGSTFKITDEQLHILLVENPKHFLDTRR